MGFRSSEFANIIFVQLQVSWIHQKISMDKNHTLCDKELDGKEEGVRSEEEKRRREDV